MRVPVSIPSCHSVLGAMSGDAIDRVALGRLADPRMAIRGLLVAGIGSGYGDFTTSLIIDRARS